MKKQRLTLSLTILMMFCSCGLRQANDKKTTDMEQCNTLKDTILKDYEQINDVFYNAQSAVMFEVKEVADDYFSQFPIYVGDLKKKYQSLGDDENNKTCIGAFLSYIETLEVFFNSYLVQWHEYYEYAETLDQLEDEQMNELENLIQELDIKKVKEQQSFENQINGTENDDDLDY